MSYTLRKSTISVVKVIFRIFSFVFAIIEFFSIVERLNINVVDRSPATYSAVLLDNKYENIRAEAIHAGILLKETDEKLDEIINDGHTIKSLAQNIQSNAFRFYQNLIRSEKFIRCCQFVFLIAIIMIVIGLIGKFVFGK